MWLFTTAGFFSIVRKSHPSAKGRPVQVRARNRADLVRLVKLAGITGAEAEIIDTPNADYCARLAIKDKTLGLVMSKLGDTIEYDNFKNSIAATPDQRDKLHALHDIWGVMYRYQGESAAPAIRR